MRPVLTAEQARALEGAAEASGTSVATLMERAGHAVARAAVELAGGAYGRRAVVMCGTGNNGGDGFVAARYLDAWGMRVTVLLANAEEPREPAGSNLRRLAEGGARVLPFDAATARRELERSDVAVDAVLGIGLRGAPRPPSSDAIAALAGSGAPVVSVDIPSGIDSETGQVLGLVVRPAVTVAFGVPKVGNVLGPGEGTLRVVDIGFPDDEPRSPQALLVERGDVPIPDRRRPDATKRDAVVLVVAGSRTMTGAPALVACGAYRAGAGYVSLAVPASILPVVQGAIREAVFVPLPEGPAGAIAASSWEILADRFASADVVAVGPGLSSDDEAADLIRRLVRECPIPLVVDADAINAFAGRAEEAADRKADVVLTPHAGELGRLLGRTADEVGGDRLDAVRAAAELVAAPVLLKGSPTLVGDPSGTVRIVTTGTAALATAGTGDVLTGVIAAFTARRGRAHGIGEAAVAGSYVHGLAGRLAGARFGDGTTASDVAEAVALSLDLSEEPG